MAARRKQQSINRSVNQFELDTMPHLPPARGSYRYKVAEMIKEAGGLKQPKSDALGRQGPPADG